jgi:hypothetical protein
MLDRLLDLLGGCDATIACPHAVAPVRCERNRGHEGPHTAGCVKGRQHVWLRSPAFGGERATS